MERLAIPLMAPALAPTDGREQTADNDPVETPLRMDPTAHSSARVTGTTRNCKNTLDFFRVVFKHCGTASFVYPPEFCDIKAIIIHRHS